MENVVAGRLQSLAFGEVQRYKNIAIVPSIAPDGSFRYRTLGEALAASEITITEISAAGAVPELLVVNRGQSPVLMIDGEELAGAKQNRVLNTSILLRSVEGFLNDALHLSPDQVAIQLKAEELGYL